VRITIRGVPASVVAASCVLALGTPAAVADGRPPTPTPGQVAAAKKAADKKAAQVAALQADLAVANANLAEAAQKAEIAAEEYNGAMWRLEEATRASTRAKAASAAARRHVGEERAGIAQLVTQSAQDGSALNGVTAYLGGEDPTGIMNRLGVMNSAGDSMQAKYDVFTLLSEQARSAEKNAVKEEQKLDGLAEEATALRDDAASAANLAQSAAAAIGGQRRTLLEELAKAQKISVKLATRRQLALEKVALQKAATAAETQAAAKAKAAAKKAKKDAQQQIKAADKTDQELLSLGQEGGWDDLGLPLPAGTSAGARKAIAFARAQLGEVYVWAAAGPNSWDCSGLTMMAWNRGGISLPHYSAAQYQRTKHLSATQLKPGDLVFWGTSPNTIHHVALYIGSGQIIHAPRTGDVVKVSGMYDWLPPDYFGRP
jgi:peptidoglycan DL-endopeptidase CwlO